MELFIQPLPIISWFVFIVIQSSLSVNFIIVEITLIICSIGINQLSITLFQPIFAHSFILNSIIVYFFKINQISLLFLHHILFNFLLNLRKTFVLNINVCWDLFQWESYRFKIISTELITRMIIILATKVLCT